LPGKISLQPKCVSYCYDECLPSSIGDILKAVDFPVVLATKGTQDEDLIYEMGRRGQTWITKDDRAKTRHEGLLYTTKTSVVWIRGLTHEKRKRNASLQRNASLKDILRMLVNKLDQITSEIAKARGPRYFLLYTTASKARPDQYEVFTTLRQVQDRLAGVSKR
jgi:hypothetical protein